MFFFRFFPLFQRAFNSSSHLLGKLCFTVYFLSKCLCCYFFLKNSSVSLHLIWCMYKTCFELKFRCENGEKKVICTERHRKTVVKRSISSSIRVHDTFMNKKKQGNMFIIHHREFASPLKIIFFSFISFPFCAKNSPINKHRDTIFEYACPQYSRCFFKNFI